jgi:hypothetical protein
MTGYPMAATVSISSWTGKSNEKPDPHSAAGAGHAAVAACQASSANSKLIILCYHEVAEDALSLSDPYAVDVQLLSKQLAWMKGQGYHFVSVDDILADRNGSVPAGKGRAAEL